MRSPSIFPCIMTMISNFTTFFIFRIFFSIFLYKYNKFLNFQLIRTALLLTTSFFFPFLKLVFFIAWSPKTKLFHAIFTSVNTMLIFYAFNWRHCRHWKTWGNMFPYFFINGFPGLFLHSSVFSLKHSRYMINGVLSYFWYWLNSNILVSSESITALQKYLFAHGFQWKSSLFPFAKEWRKFKQ